ncbi:MAG TPA: hypothetical protein VMS09_00870 [Paenibacillus sp.]|uniref:hypothetical protein n=1 Tax=Paenibacillus sp. TaxID=58172 RepID=UPI0028D41AAF|nr:hypothetical protein [Paenibacillus sp.]HUC90559.1 hypothetical protein [Paenibacillus sp.]
MSITTSGVAFASFRAAASGGETAFGAELVKEGFAAVRRFLEDFRIYLQKYDEEEADEAGRLLARGKAALPNPGAVSPSWAEIWREYEGIIGYKSAIFGSVPAERRSGEWQVLLDNPYTNGNIAVYPALTFLEAAYMHAYFRTGLEKNEIIRMQRIETVISHTGADGTSVRGRFLS